MFNGVRRLENCWKMGHKIDTCNKFLRCFFYTLNIFVCHLFLVRAIYGWYLTDYFHDLLYLNLNWIIKLFEDTLTTIKA